MITLEKEIFELLKQMQNENHEFRTEVNSKFEEVNTKFDKIDKQFEEVNTKFDKIDKQFDGVNTKFDKIDKQFDGVNSKLIKVDSRFDRVEKKLDAIIDQTVILTEFRTEVNLKLDRIEGDLNNVEIITSKNWNDIAKLKAVK